jgi:hypothetical protein
MCKNRPVKGLSVETVARLAELSKFVIKVSSDGY